MFTLQKIRNTSAYMQNRKQFFDGSSYMRLLIALFFLASGAPSMAQELFLQSRNPVSNRLAVFEDDARVAYLYLTRPGTPQPERDAIAYMRIQPISRAEWEAAKKSRGTPMLLKDLASPAAVIEKPVEREFSFKWSPDGNSVAILRNGAPLAFASMAEKFGYSKAVSKTSPLANAWDQARYDALFPK